MNKSALLACCAVVTLSSYSATGWAGNNKNVEGAWEAEVTLRVDAPDCTTAAIISDGGVNPFPTFYTFQKGGTLSEYGSRSAPSYRTPGHGVWKKGKKGATDTRYAFLLFDGNGIQIARVDVTDELSVTGNGTTMAGTGRYVMTDLSGNSYPFCATITADRITF